MRTPSYAATRPNDDDDVVDDERIFGGDRTPYRKHIRGSLSGASIRPADGFLAGGADAVGGSDCLCADSIATLRELRL